MYHFFGVYPATAPLSLSLQEPRSSASEATVSRFGSHVQLSSCLVDGARMRGHPSLHLLSWKRILELHILNNNFAAICLCFNTVANNKSWWHLFHLSTRDRCPKMTFVSSLFLFLNDQMHVCHRIFSHRIGLGPSSRGSRPLASTSVKPTVVAADWSRGNWACGRSGLPG